MAFLPMSGLASPILEELGREVDCARPYSSSARERSMGADTCTGLLGLVSVFHFVFGTGGRGMDVDVRAFLGLGSVVSLLVGIGVLVLDQSGRSSGCFHTLALMLSKV